MAYKATKLSKLELQARASTDIPLVVKNAAGASIGVMGANGMGFTRYAEVTVTAAEVLALFATPKTLVAAPGAGLVLDFLGALLILDYGGTAYAGIAAGEDLVVRHTDASGAIVSTTLETTGLLDGTADALRTLKRIVTDLTPVANSPLVLHLLTGEVTTGNSPLRIKVAYRVHATGL
jgi:hypothetical protein